MFFVPGELTAQTVQGQLTDARTGFAVGGVTVSLRDRSGVAVTTVQANYLGVFRITVAPPGTYSLLADALG